MPIRPLQDAFTILLMTTIGITTACSKGTPSAATSRATAAAAPAGNACDRKLITNDDVASMLSGSITTVAAIPGDPASCSFTTAGFSSATVMLRPGLGRTTVKTWNSGRMPVSSTPLAGVGDEAAWVESLHEVVAEKNDVLCDVTISGRSSAFSALPDAEQQQQIGALCNKIFTAIR